MKLSTRTRYGLRACFELAISGKILSLNELSKGTGVSEKYLEQLLSMLKKGGIVQTQRGVGGGYRLIDAPKNISVGKIFRAVDELRISDCAGDCADGSCPNRKTFIKLQNNIDKLLDETTLEDIVNDYMESNKNEGLS